MCINAKYIYASMLSFDVSRNTWYDGYRTKKCALSSLYNLQVRDHRATLRLRRREGGGGGGGGALVTRYWGTQDNFFPCQFSLVGAVDYWVDFINVLMGMYSSPC